MANARRTTTDEGIVRQQLSIKQIDLDEAKRVDGPRLSTPQ